MKETGLMFKAPLVRAILAGHKTQTRRLVDPAPAADQELTTIVPPSGRPYAISHERIDSQNLRRIRWESPVGQPGDRIYVRETVRSCRGYEVQGYKPIWFEADGVPPGPSSAWAEKATPAIHMPKWAARIWLEVTGVRVERLQQITDAECWAEGAVTEARPDQFSVHSVIATDGKAYLSPRGAFSAIWESTGGDWAANPWVWVIDFKRIEKH